MGKLGHYPWHLVIHIHGYDFAYMEDDQGHGGLLLSPDAPMDDEDYTDALAEAVRLYPYISDFADLMETHSAWYKRRVHGDDWEGYYDRAKVLHIAHKFLQQDELTKPDWLVQFAEDLAFNRRPARPEPPPKPPKKKSEKPGFVYLLKSDKGFWKIGRTQDPESRGKTFGIQLPFEVEFECLIKTENMLATETELHEKFAGKRTNGEWFDLSPDDVAYIKGLATND